MKEKQQLKALTSLRMFAAAMVVLQHSLGRFGIPNSAAGPFVMTQRVSFFIVLSGFILAHVYPTLPRGKLKQFWLARVARIWPLHFVCFVIVALGLTTQANSPGPLVALSNVTLTHAWVPITSWFLSYNYVSWSVSTELFFYLSFPFLIRSFSQTWFYKLVLAFALAAAMITFARVGGFATGPLENIGVSGLVYVHPLARVFEFVLGMCAALVFARLSLRPRPSRGVGTALEVVVITALVVAMSQSANLANSLQQNPWVGAAGAQWVRSSGSCLLFAATIVIVGLNSGMISSLLSARPLVHLGKISYATCLAHPLLLSVCSLYAQGQWENYGWPAYVGFWLALLLLSDLLWRWVEQPARDWILRRPSSLPSLRWRSASLAHKWNSVQLVLLCLVVLVAWNPPSATNKLSDELQWMDNSTRQDLVARTPEHLRDVSFGRRFKLLACALNRTPEGVTLELGWESEEETAADRILAVHLLDAKGTMLGQADRRQTLLRGVVPKARQWKETIHLSTPMLTGVTRIGLALYLPKHPSLVIDRGTRDWNNTRLLVEVPQQ
jgi:peptidoglycan/LPS O-acetylase OafA/YrhL